MNRDMLTRFIDENKSRRAFLWIKKTKLIRSYASSSILPHEMVPDISLAL